MSNAKSGLDSFRFIKAIVDAPFPQPLDYLNVPELNLKVGERCVVPLGRREVVAVIVELSNESNLEVSKLKKIIKRIDSIEPLSANWLRLTFFASKYYQSTWGQVALASLPLFFRRLPKTNHEKALSNWTVSKRPLSIKPAASLPLTEEQSKIVNGFNLNPGFKVSLLFGVTGSGKTEVYLRLIEQLFKKEKKAQVLLMVPEINLAPQLVERVQDRFPSIKVQVWNSKITESKKSKAWFSCHTGDCSILVGTRLSVFASFKHLKMIIIDEEHDTSFKSMEGVRYSARDLAIKRAQIEGIPILLGSATPSLETYQHALEGHYGLYKLTQRANKSAHLPQIELISLKTEKSQNGFSKTVKESIGNNIDRKEQSILFINRRGFAPVVECKSCGWQSMCPHCSAYAVYHKVTGRLTCHHCGWSSQVPTACPKCGSLELEAIGRGTQRVEEEIDLLWPKASVLRIDQDSTRLKGSLDKAIQDVHQGDVDIVVGTQMVAKGHDFKKVSLVVVLNIDSQLLSSDYRARERLFSVLMQVAGRAGRAETSGRVLIQTRYPDDPIFDYLKQHDFHGFALAELSARRQASLSPFSAQALVVAEEKKLDKAIAFLKEVKKVGLLLRTNGIRIYEPVPLSIVKVQDIERAQILIEAQSKKELQLFLPNLLSHIKQLKGSPNWYVDVDPLNI